MKNRLAITAISLAFMLTLGHMLVPHSHDIDICEEICEIQSHDEATDLLHYLQEFFCVDMGDDHLEHFSAIRDASNPGLNIIADYQLHFPLALIGYLYAIQDSQGISDLPDAPQNDRLPNSPECTDTCGLRAPPVV